ncbi:hypothetical protein [Caballeronia sp. LZ035]|uniref:hypothetical protein n=1 Tax=Caballeronia sp. LZ035 TaxID=3038568 RepID=UPI00285A1FB7|nr:hypothetical protein [Caballeronia sp. LZ035]MDR5756510.1 hypothetical protein [Caballeronia sp. LZ035]
MKNDMAASAATTAPAMGWNFWLWLSDHDINWWVAVATLAYIGASFAFALRKDQRDKRPEPR